MEDDHRAPALASASERAELKRREGWPTLSAMPHDWQRPSIGPSTATTPAPALSFRLTTPARNRPPDGWSADETAHPQRS